MFLWACLDSLHRLTRSPCEIFLIDAASDDPGIGPVIDGFARRDLFARVIRLERNEPRLVWSTIAGLVEPSDELIAYVESDVVIEPGAYGCWLARMAELVRADPKLAMLGSAIDKSDFISLEAARRIAPELPEEVLRDHIYASDPERDQEPDAAGGSPLFSPHNPAGRLLVLRTAALRIVGAASDSDMHERLLDHGYTTAISTEVRHRHLSLLNIFDYPLYDVGQRNAYMAGLSYKTQAEAAGGGIARQRDPDIHVLADGVRMEPRRDADLLVFDLPEAVTSLRLVSRRGYAFGTSDLRQLGIGVDLLRLDGRDVLADPALGRG